MMKGFLKVPLTTFLLLFCISTTQVAAQDSGISPEERARAVEYFIQGITDFENEDYERSLDNLTAAHLILSDDPGINYALSDVYMVMGDYSNAAYYGRLAANAEPENKWYHLQLAEIHRRSGRMDTAIQALDSALEHHPNNTDILFLKAALYTEIGELGKSNETYNRILQVRGSDFEIHLRRFQNYNALGQKDAALAELEKMRDLNPGNLSTLHTISQFYLELDDEKSALETLMEARERNPRDPQTLILLAEIYINNREWQQLGETFVTILEDPLIYPSQKMELVRFIYSQHQQNPAESVLAEQTEAVILAFSRSEKEYAPAQLIAADFFLQRNEQELALETLERATEAAPDEAEAWVQRLQLLFSMQRYDEVIELSEQASENAPNNGFIKFFTGVSYMLTDQPGMAEGWLLEAAEAPGRRNFRSIVYGSLGDVKQDLDKWEEAVEAYEMALRLDSNNHNAMNNYAYFMSLRRERLDYALELAEKAISMEPGNAAYLDTVGWIHFKKGNYEEARRYIQMSVDTGDASPEVYEHLGDVYSALGDDDSARTWWQKALDEDPERDYLKERLQ
jgi:tetratricopeptide (TPR) repeat protein